MLAAGVQMAVVSKRLGHSSVKITSDTYSTCWRAWARCGRRRSRSSSAREPHCPHNVLTYGP